MPPGVLRVLAAPRHTGRVIAPRRVYNSHTKYFSTEDTPLCGDHLHPLPPTQAKLRAILRPFGDKGCKFSTLRGCYPCAAKTALGGIHIAGEAE